MYHIIAAVMHLMSDIIVPSRVVSIDDLCDAYENASTDADIVVLTQKDVKTHWLVLSIMFVNRQHPI
jgi:hypothetical protein